MNKKNYLEDITEIKELMTESSKFRSLTGLSGLYSGIYALLAASYFYWKIKNEGGSITHPDSSFIQLILILLLVVLALSTITTLFLTRRKAWRNKKKAWSQVAKKLAFNFYGVLSLGGLYLIIQFTQEQYESLVALMLIFYGMAIINGAKYTFKGVSLLGYIQIFLGLACALVQDYDFWFWAVGFGFVHVIYGSIMHFKYGK